jgi:uncharacterized protein YgiM (DUF1202 family)
MIRLTILLCAALFFSMYVMGEDRGQMRQGLIEGEKEAAIQAAKAALAEQATPAAQDEVASQSNVVTPARPVQTAASPDQGVVTIAFSPSTPVVSQTTPAPKPAEIVPAATDVTPSEGRLMYVSGRSVNVRRGPSTREAVVGRLTRGEAVTVVWVEDNGWARIRVEGDGIDGYMAMDFLTDTVQ